MINVAFEHWQYIFPEEELIRFGSPHFDRKSAGQVLSESVNRAATKKAFCSLKFDQNLILAANEVFPEAAVANPLADLEVWDEWRSGIRSFPYPGRYGRLGIRRQDAKTSSTSSTGVLGEIMAGLFAQAGVAPWILVRVIRRWPDFIMYLPGNRYAFVEAKAYTQDMVGKNPSTLRIPPGLLGECVVDAVQQLNSDPYVQVWGAFTYIDQIDPMCLQVTFLELDVGDNRRKEGFVRVLPEAVTIGIAERALRGAINAVEESTRALLQEVERKPRKADRRKFEKAIVPVAMQILEDLLVEEEVKTAVLASRTSIEAAVRQLIRKASIPERGEGEKLFSARERSKKGSLSFVRNVGSQSLLIGALGQAEYSKLTIDWEADWRNANKPWARIHNVDVWRCGGAFFAVGDRILDGKSIEDPI